jgi:hypothetical protein
MRRCGPSMFTGRGWQSGAHERADLLFTTGRKAMNWLHGAILLIFGLALGAKIGYRYGAGEKS